MARSEFEGIAEHYHGRKRSRLVAPPRAAGFRVVNYSLPVADILSNLRVFSYGKWERSFDRKWKHKSIVLFRKWKREYRGRMLGRVDYGGAFWKETVTLSPPTYDISYIIGKHTNVQKRHYVGELYPSPACQKASKDFGVWSRDAALEAGFTHAELIAIGTEGINRALPDVPPINLFAYLGELREGLPRIPGSTLIDWSLIAKNLRKDPRRIRYLFTKGSPVFKEVESVKDFISKLGSEYLGWSFGVAPTAQMVTDTADIVANYDTIKGKMERDLGKTIRRRRSVLESVETSTTTTQNVEPYPLDWLSSKGTLTTKTEVTRRAWVVCSFNYRPALVALQKATVPWQQYFALVPGADSLWELTPYSWLSDYFANIGTVLSSMSHMARNGIGLDYAYSMGYTRTRTTWTWTGSWNGSLVTTSQTRDVEVKQRIRATPFGFAPNLELTAKQIAILAALGVSKRSLS